MPSARPSAGGGVLSRDRTCRPGASANAIATPPARRLTAIGARPPEAALDGALQREADDGGWRQRQRQHQRVAQAAYKVVTKGDDQPQGGAVVQGDLERLGLLAGEVGGPAEQLGISAVCAEEETGSSSVGPCASPSAIA